MGIAVGADAMTRWMWSLPLDRFTISRLGDSVVVHYANAIQWFYLLFATGWLAFSVLITIVAAGPVEWLFVVLFWLSGIVLAYGAVGASLTTTVVVLADTMTIQCRRLRRGNPYTVQRSNIDIVLQLLDDRQPPTWSLGVILRGADEVVILQGQPREACFWLGTGVARWAGVDFVRADRWPG
jgi:hypothetical protein